jgi:crotonobetainyl-CoA:carnitine CoA-transferase CaiB-like acyl-CoA transferase
VQPPWVGRRDPHVAARARSNRCATPLLDDRRPTSARDSRSSSTTSTSRSRPPSRSGASTDAVLRDIAGLSDDDLARLRRDGVIA